MTPLRHGKTTWHGRTGREKKIASITHTRTHDRKLENDRRTRLKVLSHGRRRETRMLRGRRNTGVGADGSVMTACQRPAADVGCLQCASIRERSRPVGVMKSATFEASRRFPSRRILDDHILCPALSPCRRESTFSKKESTAAREIGPRPPPHLAGEDALHRSFRT